MILAGVGWGAAAVALFALALTTSSARRARAALATVEEQARGMGAELEALREEGRRAVAAADQRARAALARANAAQHALDGFSGEAPVAFAVLDPGGQLLFVTRQWVERVGVDRALGSGWRGLVAQAAAGRPAASEAEWIVGNDGSGRWFVCEAAPYGAPGGVQLYARDVTDLHDAVARHEEQVEVRLTQIEALNIELSGRAEQAESATRAKSAFLANVSHEIRTPMNAIIGFTHILRRAETRPERLGMLDRVSEAGHHLLGVVNDVLDLSKIEAGKLTLVPMDFLLDGVIRRVCRLVNDRVDEKGLTLVVETHDLPRAVRGDPTRLSQALLNYLSNAVKFTTQGQITVRARLMRETADGYHLLFEVEDTGQGIHERDLPRLFSAFEQADGSTTRRHGGSGLGLAITRRLTQLMGGEAGAVSRVGVGSTFWFTVVLEKSTRQAISSDKHERHTLQQAFAAEAELRRLHAGAVVLLAEDNLLNQEIVRGLLTGAGLTVEVADNGTQAVARCVESDFALILMDMQMPETDGLEATRLIRDLPWYAHTPILALTANAFDADREECIAAGMNDHIPKPVDPLVLFQTLLHWLGAPRIE